MPLKVSLTIFNGTQTKTLFPEHESMYCNNASVRGAF